MAPRDALVRIKLGEVYRDLGRPDEAARVMRQAIQLDPAPASYWNSLGMVLGGSALADAEQAFAEAASRDADNAQYVYNLGLALQRLGRATRRSRSSGARSRRSAFRPARQRLAELTDGGR